MPSSSPSTDRIPMSNLTRPPPTIAVTTSTGSQAELEPPADSVRSSSPQSEEQQPSSPSGSSANASRASTPITPIGTDSTSISSQQQSSSCNTPASRSDTLVASEREPPSRRTSVTPLQENALQEDTVDEASRPWSRPLFAPWSSMWLANIIAICVCALTIMTLVYSHRGDVSTRWNNLAAFFQWCQADNYSKPICRRVKNESLSMPPYAPMDVIYRRLVKRFIPTQDSNTANEIDEDSSPSSMVTSTKLIAIGVVVIICAIGALALHHSHRRAVIRTQNAAGRTINDIARSLPTGIYNPGSPVDERRKSELRRRMRAFAPAEDALRLMKADAASRRSSTVAETDSETTTLQDDSSSYRRGSYPVHHEAPPYNNNDWFLFSSGTASSDPWDFQHKQQHLDKANTHKWWHTPELKLAEAHDQEHERSLRLLDTETGASTTSSDVTLHSTRHRHASLPKIAHASTEEREEKEHFYSSWLRPDPVSFGPVNIKPGKTDSALAYIGCVFASSVGGSAMQKVPMEVPLDQSKLSWMPMSPQDTI